MKTPLLLTLPIRTVLLLATFKWHINPLERTCRVADAKYFPGWQKQKQPQIIPGDVRTCRNSTYDLCTFDEKCHRAIGAFVIITHSGLRKSFLERQIERGLIMRLNKILKVAYV